MSGFATCDMCNGRMIEIESRIVGGVKYSIYKCEKCGHIVAKHS